MIKIKLLAMDVDGTMTDGSINISASGELFKSFDVHDGMGIKTLHDNGIYTAIITGRNSEIVSYRAKELKITDVLQGVDNKLLALESIITKYNLKLDEVAYIGDDLNDVDVMDRVSISFCPSNAVEVAKNHAKVILTSPGGHGAIRECSEYILKYNNQ